VIAAGLSAGQFQFTKPATDSTAAGGNAPRVSSYHIASGNQNFYVVPLPSDGSAADGAQRLAVVEQLLAASSNPAATEALTAARAALSKSPGK